MLCHACFSIKLHDLFVCNYFYFSLCRNIYFQHLLSLHLRHWEAAYFLWLHLLPSTCPAQPVRSAFSTCLSVWRGDSILPESTSVLLLGRMPFLAFHGSFFRSPPPDRSRLSPGRECEMEGHAAYQPQASSSPSLWSWCPDQRSPHTRPSPNS